MRLEYTKNLNDVLAKENEFLSDRRYKAAKEFGVATVNKKLQLTSEDGKLTPAQQAYKDTLAQPVVPRIRGAESRGAVGMAFSGGGIRSASFNFGLVQGLARYGVLPWVDYLSSVSGGGFTAGCLTSLLSYDRKDEKGRREYYHFNTQWDYFPFNPYVQAFNANGAAHSREATLEEINQNVGPPLAKGNNTQLVYLRNKSNYLIPRMGWFGSDSLRVIGSVFKTSYTVFIFLLVLFAISSFVYGLTTALIPYRLERFDIPMEQTYLEGKVESVIDTSKLLVLIFGSVDQVNFDGTSDISTGLYPTREYVLTLAFGFLISILIGVLFANF